MRARWLALVPLLAVPLASTVHAAPTKVPQVKDPGGDAVGGRPGMDIVSVLYTTAGTGKGRSYVPKKFIVTMTLAGTLEEGPGVNYEVEAKTDTCGEVTLTYAPGTPYTDVTGINGWARWERCLAGDGSSNSELLSVHASGKAVVWEFSLKATPLEIGTEFRDFRARVDPANPLIPFPSSTTGTERGLIDIATGSGTWKVG